MKILLLIIICGICSAFDCKEAEKVPGCWNESGVLPYSYAYARSYMGHELRKQGWICKTGFTAGAKRQQEHSVWQKGSKRMQLMIWRIDSGKTGYSKGEIVTDKQSGRK